MGGLSLRPEVQGKVAWLHDARPKWRMGWPELETLNATEGGVASSGRGLLTTLDNGPKCLEFGYFWLLLVGFRLELALDILGGGWGGSGGVSDLKVVRILHFGLKSGQNTTFS